MNAVHLLMHQHAQSNMWQNSSVSNSTVIEDSMQNFNEYLVSQSDVIGQHNRFITTDGQKEESLHPSQWLTGDALLFGQLSSLDDEQLNLMSLLLKTFNDIGLLEEEMTEKDLLALLDTFDLTEEALQQLIDQDKLDLSLEELHALKHLLGITEVDIDIIQLLTEVNQLLNDFRQSVNNDVLKEISRQLLNLLKQWSNLNNQNEHHSFDETLKNELSKENRQLWKSLTAIYEKRAQMMEHGNYKQNSSINRSDVMMWLQKLSAESEMTNNQSEAINGANYYNRVMSDVEQYVIYVQDSSRIEQVERVNQEVMRQFNQIVSQSRMFTLNAQSSELSISIRPENLGNMTLRFTQIDGETIVKIIVSSQMTKDLLESNRHQLKHLFAPHQVIIERDSSVSDEQFFHQEATEEELQDEQAQSETKEEQETEQEERETVDFQTLLSQVRGE